MTARMGSPVTAAVPAPLPPGGETTAAMPAPMTRGPKIGSKVPSRARTREGAVVAPRERSGSAEPVIEAESPERPRADPALGRRHNNHDECIGARDAEPLIELRLSC